MHILVMEPFKERHMVLLREAAGERATLTQVAEQLPADEQRALLRSADAVIGEPPLTLLAEDVPVRWVQMSWAGTDMYTRAAIPFPAHMMLTNVAGTAYGHIISQYVLGQVLAIAQNLPAYHDLQRERAWQSAGPVMTLDGAKVLVFGAGDIGSYTARRFAGFDASCTGVCRDTSRVREGFDRLVTLADAEALLPWADVVVNCLPNTDETVRYLDERRLRCMKRGAILVNVGRGNFIDCEALARVLAEGHLRGAALDVTDPEPLPADHPLWSEPRCIITPHQSGGAFGKCDATEDRICAVCCENIRRFVAGEPLTHRVR
ncbi:MAG: D-2-hydroxyacid dehydrogenase [Coriobacteriales bacterium]|nr:D-2-hydroxyacid dehydrogenase [Coriobacteriales bacterium]